MTPALIGAKGLVARKRKRRHRSLFPDTDRTNKTDYRQARGHDCPTPSSPAGVCRYLNGAIAGAGDKITARRRSGRPRCLERMPPYTTRVRR